MNEETLNIIKAGLSAGIDIDNIEEAYQGQWSSDEDFAMQIAEDFGFEAVGDWPAPYIDWERAAADLMMDYVESDGYYFRNL